LYKALSLQGHFLDPNCPLVWILSVVKKLTALLYITFSDVSENVSDEISLHLEMQDFSPSLVQGLNSLIFKSLWAGSFSE
jgi:hypothetical protein